MTKNQIKVIEKESTALLVPEATGSWGSDNVSAEDIRIPKLLLCQGLSVAVADAKAEAGDIIDSISSEVLGCAKKIKEPAKDINLIPIHVWKTIVRKKNVDGKFEYHDTLPFTGSNANTPWEQVIDGVQWQNNITYNCLVMREQDADTFGAFPYVVSFSRTSANTGKDVFTLGAKAKMINKPIAAFTFTLGAELEKGDKGSYYVFKVKGTKPTANLNEVAPNLKMWFDTFNSGKATVDNSDLVAESGATEPDFVPF